MSIGYIYMRYNIIYDHLSLSYIAMMYPPVPEEMQLFQSLLFFIVINQLVYINKIFYQFKASYDILSDYFW